MKKQPRLLLAIIVCSAIMVVIFYYLLMIPGKHVNECFQQKHHHASHNYSKIICKENSENISDSGNFLHWFFSKYLRKTERLEHRYSNHQTPVPCTANATKTILFWTPSYHNSNRWKGAERSFLKCPCTCVAEYSQSMILYADAVLFFGFTIDMKNLPYKRVLSQPWIFYSLEPPTITTRNGFHGNMYADFFNWTMTYRTDSDIYIPYKYYVQQAMLKDWKQTEKNATEEQNMKVLTDNEIVFNSTKLVVAMISNCKRKQRLKIVQELQKYVPVEVFGRCTQRPLCKNETTKSLCLTAELSHYKFYLSFENSQCLDYITEKYWTIPFKYGLVPIVWGTTITNYAKIAIPGSYIHNDEFASTRELAQYLLLLDSNETLYNKYFNWKERYTIKSTDGWCKLCQRLHETNYKQKVYHDFHSWWEESCKS